MPSNHPQSTIPTTRLRSSLLVRIAACVSAAILMLIFAIIVYLVSGVGQREFEPRFPPLLMIAWTSLWTVGAAALLLTRIGALAVPLPRWLLRVGPWVLAAFFACFRRRVLTQLNRGETATRSRATSVTATAANCASATAKARKNSSACSA